MKRYELFSLTKVLLALFLASSIYYAGGQNTTSVSIKVNPLPDFTTQSLTACFGYPADLHTAILNLTNAELADLQFSTSDAPDFNIGLISNPSTYVAAVPGDLTIFAKATNGDLCESDVKPFVLTVRQVIASPKVQTPQTFCSGATVADLQAEGANIQWYDSGHNLLSNTTVLSDGATYYAAHQYTGCASYPLSPVTVIINSDVFLEAPYLPGPFTFCAPATLADIPLYGNTNIVWYDALSEGTKYTDPSAIALVNGGVYYAAQSGGGTCESALRTEVIVAISSETPEEPLLETPQHLCDGALIGNLETPNNQIVWYAAASGGTALEVGTRLTAGTYYAAQKTGDCESDVRTAVEVILDGYPQPNILTLQPICGIVDPTLADLKVTGTGIVWYAAETGGSPLPLSTAVSNNQVYWVAQSSGSCESDRVQVTITNVCYDPQGTIFPFVHTGDETLDGQFVTSVNLYALPPAGTLDKICYIRKHIPLYAVPATYYDGTEYIAGTPKYPGLIGNRNNPGLPIRWNEINFTPNTSDNTPVTGPGDVPAAPLGKFTFNNVAAGDYVIEIIRQGFISRYGVVTVADGQTYLGHRELLAGDVNDDLQVNENDASSIQTRIGVRYGNRKYNAKYDSNGDKQINSGDNGIIKVNLGIYITIYQETYDFINQ